MIRTLDLGVTDSELLDLFFQEDRRHYAFNLIVRANSEKLYWLIRRIVLTHEDANDVLQNTFIKVWKGLPNFKGNSTLYSWMYRIATNESLSFLKKKQKESSHGSSSLLNDLKEDPYFDGDVAYLHFLSAIEELPEKQKLVFKMKYFEELSYKEIAEVQGGSIGSLKASYFHAVKKNKRNTTVELNLSQ